MLKIKHGLASVRRGLVHTSCILKVSSAILLAQQGHGGLLQCAGCHTLPFIALDLGLFVCKAFCNFKTV